MLANWQYALISVVIVSLISLIGIITLAIKIHKLKKILIYLVSFSAGALLGDAFIHLLPEAAQSGFTLSIAIYTITGIAFSFIIEKIIHWRHCHTMEESHIHPFALVNLWGDSVHNFIDGLIIGAAYLANFEIGLATTIAVILHEIPQEIGDFAVFIHGGASKFKAIMFNFFSGLAAILGLLVSLSASLLMEEFTVFLVPFAAGSLIYIATADLIPELHKEVAIRKSLLQFALFILGIIVMLSLLLVE